MHELPIVKNVLNVTLEYAEKCHATQVNKVVLIIGQLHDLLPEWVEKFFKYASKGTIAENAKILIEHVPIICRCKSCQGNFVMHINGDEGDRKCPDCGSDSFSLLSGREFIIDKIEVCVPETE